MKLTNLTQRDSILLRFVIRLRYETQPEQLRHVLAGLRKLLLAHPKVAPEPARVRLAGLGETSLDLEVFAYVETQNWDEFLAIREDIVLRVLDVVAESGTALAVPAQTVYMTRDRGLDPQRSEAAEAEVHRWREDGQLPFPSFDKEFIELHRDTLDYRPADSQGSSDKPQKS